MKTQLGTQPILDRIARSALARRLVIGILLVATYAAVLLLDEYFLFPWCPLWLVFHLVVVIAAALEVCTLFKAAGAPPSTNTVLGGTVAVVLANWVPHIAHRMLASQVDPTPVFAQLAMSIHALAWPFLALVGVLMVALLSQSIQFTRPGKTTITLGATILAIAYLGCLGTFALQTRWLGGPARGITAAALLMAAAKGSDIGAYTLGRLFGRHKLWPRLSPKKTIEGALGGLAAAVAFAFLIAEVSRRITGIAHQPGAILAFGLLVGAAAQLGDLVESMLKRDCERKDASDTIPGFGGVLDVIDSALFASPIAFAFWLLVEM